MFELIVTSYDQVHNIVDSGWPTRIISLINLDIPHFGPHHLHLTFDDTPKPSDGWVHPVEADFLKILEFTKDLTDDDRVLVHCLAGKGRSTSAAIAILIQHGMNFEDAFNLVAAQRPFLVPNKMIISFTDDHFNLGGKLVDFISNSIHFQISLR